MACGQEGLGRELVVAGSPAGILVSVRLSELLGKGAWQDDPTRLSPYSLSD